LPNIIRVTGASFSLLTGALVEEQKDYLIKVWDEKSAEKAKAQKTVSS